MPAFCSLSCHFPIGQDLDVRDSGRAKRGWGCWLAQPFSCVYSTNDGFVTICCQRTLRCPMGRQHGRLVRRQPSPPAPLPKGEGRRLYYPWGEGDASGPEWENKGGGRRAEKGGVRSRKGAKEGGKGVKAGGRLGDLGTAHGVCRLRYAGRKISANMQRALPPPMGSIVS